MISRKEKHLKKENRLTSSFHSFALPAKSKYFFYNSETLSECSIKGKIIGSIYVHGTVSFTSVGHVAHYQ